MLNRLSKNLSERQILLPALLFALNVFLVFSIFVPTMRDINTWDESVYVNTGRSLVAGELPTFARNPLVGAFYAILYLIHSHSPLWMLDSISLGRFLLFALLWLSSYLIARRFSQFFPPLAITGLFLLFPATVDILLNPSDALFAAMSGFAFWQLISFYDDRDTAHLWKASLFLGLSALSRNDGLVLFVLFLLLVVLVVARTRWNFQWVFPSLLPFVFLVGGYMLLYGALTGHFESGTKERSYVAFQQGQSVDYRRDPACRQKFLKCAVLRARELYGSGEENNYSILRAISRNPGAFATRFARTVALLPGLFRDVYGERMWVFLAILSGRGLWELLRRKEYLLTALLLLWITHLSVYFLTFFRAGYLRTPYFIPFVLAAIGACALVQDATSRKVAYVQSALLLSVTVAAMVLDIRTLYFTTALLFVALWVIHFVSASPASGAAIPAFGLVILLVTGLILRPAFEPPVGRPLSQGAEEQALLVMEQKLPPGTLVAAGSPGGVWAADMQFEDLGDDEYYTISSPADLHALLKERDIRAIYVDSSLSNANQPVWELIEPGLGQFYETIFSGREGSIRVLLVN